MATVATQPADVLRCHLQIDHKLGFNNFKSHISERGIFRNIIEQLFFRLKPSDWPIRLAHWNVFNKYLWRVKTVSDISL